MRPMAEVKIDLGCGNARREGYIGLDYVEGEQVDHVLDLTKEPYPFDDRSVDAVFSAHFLEHIEEPNHVFSEIGRICKDGAAIEFWTPYAFSNEAFVYGHTHFLTEEDWLHFCVSHRDLFMGMLGGRWQLRKIVYSIPPENVAQLEREGVGLDFAVKYFKGVVREFGVEIEFRADPATPVIGPDLVYVTERFGPQQPLTGGGGGWKRRFRR
jgi:SAM-dependent methyltransferase